MLKRIVGFILFLISILGINFIPLEMVLYRDFSGESAMFFYALENITAIIFATLLVLLFAPAREENHEFVSRYKTKNKELFPMKKLRQKKEILQAYLVFSVGFSVSSIIFLVAFIFLILKADIQFVAIANAFKWIICLQIVELIGILILFQPLTLAKAEIFLKGSISRVAILFLAVFIGIFFAFLVDRWFIVPFIILKTLVDLAEIIREFRYMLKPSITKT